MKHRGIHLDVRAGQDCKTCASEVRAGLLIKCSDGRNKYHIEGSSAVVRS